ncbi:hypothetical protein M0657_009936 [Pyricularia oryzae]|nr:hypothetical protein M9X92_011602 [Pyricularia oryzae]KAI7913615.1 hypothetical protein M0657_009936 [Pyricularia oryzae]
MLSCAVMMLTRTVKTTTIPGYKAQYIGLSTTFLFSKPSLSSCNLDHVGFADGSEYDLAGRTRPRTTKCADLVLGGNTTTLADLPEKFSTLTLLQVDCHGTLRMEAWIC